MRFLFLLAAGFLPLALLIGQAVSDRPAPTAANAPAFTRDGRMLPPTNYRQWIYLTSGLDMSYSPRVAGMDGMSMFDNVFVDPASWQAFQQTGTWPDKTVLVLEVRGAETKTSINKGGHSQSVERMGMEVHVKDASRGGWAFYEFDSENPTPAKMVPKTADCYTCHQAHGAVDTTFVQFYPTLLPLAKQKGTLSAAYLKEEAK